MTDHLADVERELCRIPEVRAARIVADGEGHPVEVHVLAVPGKHAKQIVRDVQSVAMASAGLTIDHRIVSVVQLDDPVGPAAAPAAQADGGNGTSAVHGGTGEQAGDVLVLDASGPEATPADRWAGPPEAAVSDEAPMSGEAHPAPAEAGASPVLRPRIAVERVLTLRRGLTCTAEVVLRLGDEIVTGDADGSAAASSTLRLVAEATLDALRQLRPAADRAYVESASLARVAERSIALTSLVLVVPPNEELVTGSAPVRGAGEHEAVARSVLDAMNRRLQEQRPPSQL